MSQRLLLFQGRVFSPGGKFLGKGFDAGDHIVLMIPADSGPQYDRFGCLAAEPRPSAEQEVFLSKDADYRRNERRFLFR